MHTQVSPHSRRGRRTRHMLTLGGLASGLLLALPAVLGVMPVAAQTATTPIPQLQDRGLAPDADRLLIQDRRLDDAFASGLDDPAIADPLLINDVPQEDRQVDRQLEVGDDRLSIQPATQLETGDLRQGDRSPARRSDDVVTTYYGSTTSTTAAPLQEDRSATPDVRQEDRSATPGDVRQEDRSATPDVRQEDRSATRGSDDVVTTYYGSTTSTVAAPTVHERSGSSSSSSAPSKSGSSGSSGSGSGGSGRGDGGGHH